MKDLKQEYEQMLLEDIPDIWDRIEANLPTEDVVPKQPVVAPSLPDYDIKNDTAKHTTSKVTTVKKPNKTKILRWATVFAACLCVLIILPFMNMNRSMNESASAPANIGEYSAETNGSNSKYTDAVAEAAPVDEYREEAVEEEYAEIAIEGEVFEDSAEFEKEEAMNKNTMIKEETSGSTNNETVDEVVAQITEPIIDNETVIGYQIIVLEESYYFYKKDSIDVYFSDEYDNTAMELSTDTVEKEYFMHIIYNKESSRYEIVDME